MKLRTELATPVQHSNTQTRKSINTNHNNYKSYKNTNRLPELHITITLFIYYIFPIIIYRHATTNQIILSLVTEVKKKTIYLRMVKVWPKHVGEF